MFQIIWNYKYKTDVTCYIGECGGSVVECRTPEREVGGSKPTAAVLCPWARHFTPRKYWLITQEAVAPSRHDWKIVDWDVKPQNKNKQTNKKKTCYITVLLLEVSKWVTGWVAGWVNEWAHRFNDPLTSRSWRGDLGLYSHPKRLERLGIEQLIFGLQCHAAQTGFITAQYMWDIEIPLVHRGCIFPPVT